MSGGSADSEEREKERERKRREGGGQSRRERERKRKKERTRDVEGNGDGDEVSRDDAVVRLQGRRKEEPRREPVPVTGPPAGRRTRHTAPYRPLLSHSLPSPLYALRPSCPVCYLLANLASRFLQPVTRIAFKFFKQCQLACTTALITLPSLVIVLPSTNCILTLLLFFFCILIVRNIVRDRYFRMFIS